MNKIKYNVYGSSENFICTIFLTDTSEYEAQACYEAREFIKNFYPVSFSTILPDDIIHVACAFNDFYFHPIK